jgi:hypothetical protein
MRYSRDKETIEESPSVNAGCRMSLPFNGWFERELEFELNIRVWAPPPKHRDPRELALYCGRLLKSKPQSVVLRRPQKRRP